MINEAELSRQFCEKHPVEAAAVLMQIAPAAAAEFLAGIAPPDAALLLQHMLPGRSSQTLLHLPAEALPAILGRLNLTEAAGMLRPLDAAERARLFNALPGPLRARLSRLVGFPPDTIGSLLATPPLTLREDWTVKYSLREFKRVPPTTVAELPVVDQDHLFTGSISLHRLLSQRDDLRVGALIDNTLPALPADAPLASVAQHPHWDRSTAVPVIDHDNKLLGVLHHARLREYLGGRQGAQTLKALTPMMALAEVYWTASSALVSILGERFNSSNK